MELWNHCENPYPFVPNEVLEQAPSVRASLPNKYCDPKIAARLYDEIFDEYRLCDDLGIHIVTNEHHAGINNLWAASPVITGIVARLTSRVRILSLGTLITVRPDPVRVAEEYATIDVLSRGRLDIGFVKSGATEMVSGDANPMRIREREWEAIDLIEKTLTTHDGPVQLGGQVLHPPACQHLAAPLAAAATRVLGGDQRLADLRRARPARHRQYAAVRRLRPHAAGLRRLQDSARRGRAAGAGRGPVLVYGASAMSAIPTRRRFRIGQKIPWFLTVSIKSAPQFSKFQPGAVAPEMAPAAWRTGASRRPRPTNLDVESLVRQGQMFAGNPDTVVEQIKEFRRRVGGIGHIIMMTRQGLVTHAEAEKSFTLAAREVLPQLQDLEPLDEPAAAEPRRAVAAAAS